MNMDLAVRQHQKGKLYVEERLALLYDDGQYTELTRPEERDGVYICEGNVCGKKVISAAQDFTYKGGTLGHSHGRNIARAIGMAIKAKCPFVAINDSGGARIQEGINALAGYGEIFRENVQASGVIPQISMVLGPCAGGAVYSPGLTDFIFMVNNISQMFITGPKVIRAVTGEVITGETLGGTFMHGSNSGVAHVCCENEQLCFQEVRRMIDLIPSSNSEKRRHLFEAKDAPAFNFILPERQNLSYDVLNVIQSVFDKNSFLELQRDFAKSMVIGFARLGGETVGIIANQPCVMAGVLDYNSSDKAARFVRFCDAFGIPIASFTDVPGYLPGISQEQSGIIRHGAKLLYAFSEATVPRINIIMRKAYGGAYIAMNSRHIGADLVYCWPGAEIAVMGERGAVEILYSKTLREMDSRSAADFIREKAAEYRKDVMNSREGIAQGYIDREIQPEETRAVLLEGFKKLCQNKRHIIMRKNRHGNIPL